MTDQATIVSRRQVVGGLTALPLLASPALAQSWANRVMVQGRPQDTGSLYKVANILPALDQLGGIRKMRCREPFSGTAGWNTYVGLARGGVRFCFTLSVRDIATTIRDLRNFLTVAPGSIWAVEFPNEPDLNPVSYKGRTDPRLGFRTGNAPALMAFITDFTLAFRREPSLSAIPLIASNDFMQAEQKPYAKYGNSHIYPALTTNVADRLAGFEKKMSRGGYSQGVITEWGRTTGGSKTNATSPPVTIKQQAELLASDISSALGSSSVAAISIYELFCWQGTGEMANFGLFNNTLSPRPAVAAIRAVLR